MSLDWLQDIATAHGGLSLMRAVGTEWASSWRGCPTIPRPVSQISSFCLPPPPQFRVHRIQAAGYKHANGSNLVTESGLPRTPSLPTAPALFYSGSHLYRKGVAGRHPPRYGTRPNSTLNASAAQSRVWRNSRGLQVLRQLV